MSQTLESLAPNGQLPDSAPKLSPRAESPIERIERVKKYLHDKTLISGEDYGAIPGSQRGIPTLLKPGAQKLCGLFQLAPIVKHVEREFRPDFITYEVTYQVTNKVSGVVEGEGVGTCNSKERKYAKQDAYNVANTLLKMAGKRALVDATLNALGISSLFTQDIEDFAPEVPAAAAVEAVEAGPTDKQKRVIIGQSLRFWGDPEGHKALADYLHENYKKPLDRLTVGEAKSVFEMFQIELEKQKVAPAETAPATQPGAAPVDRWSAINAAAQAAKPNSGYLAFIAALNTRGISWASDADAVAFEAAATAKLGYPIVCEDLNGNDWENFAAMLASDELRFGA